MAYTMLLAHVILLRMCNLPFAAKVLSNDSSESLDGSQNSSMNHDRSGSVLFRLLALFALCRFSASCSVTQLELDRKVEIQLDRGTLPFSLESVCDGDVDLCEMALSAWLP